MANRYWVGGTGTWNAVSTANWAATSGGASGASAPTSADIVFIDANSGTGTITLGANIDIVRFDGRNSAINLDWNSYKISINGNNTTVWYSGGITATGISEARVEFTYSGANVRNILLRSGVGENGAISAYVTAGTGNFQINTGSTGLVQNLNFTGFSGLLVASAPNSSWTIYGDLTLSSTMTLPSQNGSIIMAGVLSAKQITTAGKTMDFPLTFNGIGGVYVYQDALTQGSSRAFTITNGTVQLKSGVTSTVGSFVANNTSTKYLQSTTAGSQATLSQASGTVSVSDLTIQDSNVIGGASWNAYADYENIDAGNNDGWNFSLSPPYATYEPPIIIRSFTQPRRF
jgi:hypothetical protein